MADTQSRPRLLLVAYACSPYRGSECAVGWQRAVGAAAAYQTWVICEGSWCGPDIRRYLSEQGQVPGLHFEFVTKGPLLRALGRIPGLYYLAYNIWHRRALAAARTLHAQTPFSLVHQATFCGYREPGYVSQLGVPFVWGPVGGTQNYPWRFLAEAGPVGAAREILRSLLNRAQLRFGVRVRRAIRTADALFAANSTIARDLARARGDEPPVLLETGVTTVTDECGRPAPHDPFRIFWCGELRAHKALPLLLKALAALPRSCRFELRIAGSGPELGRWRRMARRCGVDAHVRWLGQLTHAATLQQYPWADALTFTSLRDTSGNVVLEALAAGVPVICLDHQGVRDIVTDRCGIKIAVTTPREVVEGIRDALVMLSANPEHWRRLSSGSGERAREYLWSTQSEKMRREYRRVLAESASLGSSAVKSRRMTTGSAPVVRSAAKRAGGVVASCLNQSFGGRAGDRFGILLFHRIAPHVDGVPPPTQNVTPGRFREQITGLLDRGFVVARLDDMVEAQRHRSALSPKTFAITFDDAYETVYRNAWPVLSELGLPATVFISTAFLDRQEPFPFDRWAQQYCDVVSAETYRPITENQCREMADSGLITLGAHTHTHRDLRGCASEFQTDLADGLRQLDARFGCRSRALSFPFGYADETLIDVARATGVTCALTTRAALIEPDADPFSWGRFNVYQSDTAATLEAKLQGWYSWLPRLEERMTLGSAGSRARAVREYA